MESKSTIEKVELVTVYFKKGKVLIFVRGVVLLGKEELSVT